MLSNDRWENGSFFHWLAYQNTVVTPSPWSRNGIYFGSARDAFRSLLEYGRTERGWKRFWVPSYFCQEVVTTFISTGIEVCLYADGPEDDEPGFDEIDSKPGDVLLRTNFFGLRDSLKSNAINRDQVEIIEDHTHDPWSDCAWESDADWCIVSIRKVLPVPDGGLLWSPREHNLPKTPVSTNEHQTACLEKLAAMVLKGLYLDGHPIEKEKFRALDISGESKMSTDTISAMSECTKSLLDCFPIKEWRDQRRINHTALSKALEGISGLRVLQPTDNEKTCPFSVIIVFDSMQQREYVRQKLISNKIYPAVLWPLEKNTNNTIHQKYIEFSRNMISVHCDMRYNSQDMAIVASLIREYSVNHEEKRKVYHNERTSH